MRTVPHDQLRILISDYDQILHYLKHINAHQHLEFGSSVACSNKLEKIKKMEKRLQSLTNVSVQPGSGLGQDFQTQPKPKPTHHLYNGLQIDHGFNHELNGLNGLNGLTGDPTHLPQRLNEDILLVS